MKAVDFKNYPTIFRHNGKLVEAIGYTDQKTIIFNTIKQEDGEHCPHCKEYIKPHQFHEVEGSMNFQEAVEPVSTIKNND